jgi:acetyltransferase-like isoleucine patch superfamily enzyme
MPLELIQGGKRPASIHPDADLSVEDGLLTVGSSVQIRKNVTIDCSLGGVVNIGTGTVLFPHSMILPHGGTITIGENCTVNPFTVLYGHGGLKIGNYVRIATHCVFIPANHVFDDPNTPITKQGIAVEDDVWVGAGVRVLDGVTIGKGAVIGAGAVVNADVRSFAIVAGVPAKEIGIRGDSLKSIT